MEAEAEDEANQIVAPLALDLSPAAVVVIVTQGEDFMNEEEDAVEEASEDLTDSDVEGASIEVGEGSTEEVVAVAVARPEIKEG